MVEGAREMIISAIACCDQENLIGVGGIIPWKCPEDMAFFKWKTLRHPVIMGRKTFESFGCKPLNERINIVVSSESEKLREKYRLTECWFVPEPSLAIPQAYAVANILDLTFKEMFIIGGESIYKYFFDHKIINKVYLNKLHKTIGLNGGTKKSYFPDIPNDFENIKSLKTDEFTALTYVKKIKKG